jgi:hypothetical protein
MKFYKVCCDPDVDRRVQYFCTKSQAHGYAKDHIAKHLWPETYIDHVEIKTDQETIAEILSGAPFHEEKLKTYYLTARGGLKESNE